MPEIKMRIEMAGLPSQPGATFGDDDDNATITTRGNTRSLASPRGDATNAE